jgi:hypothetical protein
MEWWIAHNPGTYKRFRMSDGTYTDREKRPVEMADK